MTISFPKSSHHSGLRYMKRNPHPKKELIRDCGVRAICLAFDQDYEKVFRLATTNKRLNADDNSYWSAAAEDYIYRTTPDAGKGLNKEACMDTLKDLGLDVVYKHTTNTDGDGSEIYAYFHAGNLPDRCIAHVNRHWVAVRDGAIWDTWDSRGKRKKKLYGYICLRSDL